MSDPHLPITSSRERPAASMSGYVMLIAFAALLAALIFGIAGMAGSDPGEAAVLGFLAFVIPAVLLLVLIASGFYMIQPNQAASVTLFGSYRGTDRTAGLRWIWPWLMKNKKIG